LAAGAAEEALERDQESGHIRVQPDETLLFFDSKSYLKWSTLTGLVHAGGLDPVDGFKSVMLTGSVYVDGPGPC
jgi:hypothetical protein